MKINIVLPFLFVFLLFFLSLDGCTSKGETIVQKNENQSGVNSNNSKIEKIDYFIKTGDKVWVDYIGRFENGKVFDTSIKEIAKKNGIYNPNRNYGPISFIVGSGQMIPGFEKAVIGKKVGDKITVEIPPSEGYGECNPQLRKWIDKKIFQEADLKPITGEVYNFGGAIGKVINISGDKVFVDFNSPMCGKTLIFDIFIRKKQ